MDTEFFLRGLIVGVSIAATVGPIWILTMRRTLEHGFAAGLACGMGAAVADGIYGAVAAFGLGAALALVDALAPWLALAGGAFLIVLGLRTFARRVEPGDPQGGTGVEPTLARGFVTTFLLTMTNPMTILWFAAIFAGLGLAKHHGEFGAGIATVAGVVLGSAAWWVVLCGGAALAHRRVGPGLMRWINRVSGAVLTAFGVAAVAAFPR
ncbi:MAG: LysE family translocator [Alphaproteobacteria bacterium]